LLGFFSLSGFLQDKCGVNVHALDLRYYGYSVLIISLRLKSNCWKKFKRISTYYIKLINLTGTAYKKNLLSLFVILWFERKISLCNFDWLALQVHSTKTYWPIIKINPRIWRSNILTTTTSKIRVPSPLSQLPLLMVTITPYFPQDCNYAKTSCTYVYEACNHVWINENTKQLTEREQPWKNWPWYTSGNWWSRDWSSRCVKWSWVIFMKKTWSLFKKIIYAF